MGNKVFDKYLEQVGEYVELVWMGDDWGMQSGPIHEPKIFKNYLCLVIKNLSFCKIQNPTKIALHSCGSVLGLWKICMRLESMSFILCKRLPLIWGIRKIKKSFGNKLVFTPTFPINPSFHGTPEDVIKKSGIRSNFSSRRVYHFRGHNIQADVPPQTFLPYLILPIRKVIIQFII